MKPVQCFKRCNCIDANAGDDIDAVDAKKCNWRCNQNKWCNCRKWCNGSIDATNAIHTIHAINASDATGAMAQVLRQIMHLTQVVQLRLIMKLFQWTRLIQLKQWMKLVQVLQLIEWFQWRNWISNWTKFGQVLQGAVGQLLQTFPGWTGRCPLRHHWTPCRHELLEKSSCVALLL